tara:strand:+ start:953 stop:1459 length:507 start_codon:yes stop_codon:yes gene_type:complete
MSVNFLDPQIWVAISFILFFALFGSMLWNKIKKFLDDKILDIKNDIEEAKLLHDEAKKLLSSETIKYQALDGEINKIINVSKKESNDLLIENKKRIELEIANLEKSSNDKIKMLEQQIIIEIKEAVSKEAINLVIKKLKTNMNERVSSIVLDDSQEEIKKSLKNIDQL